jgi:hypothetical protein
MRTRMWASVVVVLVCFVSLLVAAQVALGALRGTVIDSSGQPIPGATVTITGPEKRSTVTNSRGEFSFVKLRSGDYEVETSLTGFATA